MNTNAQAQQARLHLVQQLTVEDDASTLFADLECAAKTIVVRSPLSADDAWNLAQFVDLADAGYGNKRSALYRCAVERLGVFVEFNLYRPQVRAMCGRAACLAAMAAKALDDHAEHGVAPASFSLRAA